jgi:hypothetical protein
VTAQGDVREVAGMGDWRPKTGRVLCCARARYRRAYLYWRPFAGIYCENCDAFILTCHPILAWIWTHIFDPIVGWHAYRIHLRDPVHVKVVNAEGRDQVGDRE